LLSLSDVSNAFYDNIFLLTPFYFNINSNIIMKCAWNVR